MKALFLLSICFVAASVTSQTASKDTCSVSGDLLKRVWELERKLTVMAPHSPAPATAVREFLKEGDADTKRKALFACAFNDNLPQATKEMFMTELTNLEFIINSQSENGGLAQGKTLLFQRLKGCRLI